jgi:NarL family two-component system response regulator LiaR
MSEITVYMVDDHTYLRQGLRAMLRTRKGIRVVGEAGTAAEALEGIARTRPRVLVLDLRLPDLSGVGLVRRFVEAFPRTSIVVLSSWPVDRLPAHLIRVGAGAFLPKGGDPSVLADAIRTVARGVPYITPELQAAIEANPDGRMPHESLGLREYEAFLLLLEGRSNGQVADAMGVSPSTASRHVATIMSALDVDTRQGIFVYATRAGLL